MMFQWPAVGTGAFSMMTSRTYGRPNANAFSMARKAARVEGMPVGISSGGALAAACELGRRSGMEGKRILVILPSFAERYLSTALFADEENGAAHEGGL